MEKLKTTKIPKFDNLTGESPPMKLVFQRINEVASSDVTVLILSAQGEQ